MVEQHTLQPPTLLILTLYVNKDETRKLSKSVFIKWLNIQAVSIFLTGIQWTCKCIPVRNIYNNRGPKKLWIKKLPVYLDSRGRWSTSVPEWTNSTSAGFSSSNTGLSDFSLNRFPGFRDKIDLFSF